MDDVTTTYRLVHPLTLEEQRRFRVDGGTVEWLIDGEWVTPDEATQTSLLIRTMDGSIDCEEVPAGA